MSEVKRPLEGVKVLELATFIAAPCCARFLADLGAEVIKVEAPAGDPLRYTAVNEGRPQDQKENTSYDLENAGKTCVCLNTKTAAGREALEKLIAEADIFITNWRQNPLKKAGLDYETLHAKYPRLVYGFVSGYGEKGPDKDLPGFDFTAFFARGGILGKIHESTHHICHRRLRRPSGGYVPGLRCAGGPVPRPRDGHRRPRGGLPVPQRHLGCLPAAAGQPVRRPHHPVPPVPPHPAQSPGGGPQDQGQQVAPDRHAPVQPPLSHLYERHRPSRAGRGSTLLSPDQPAGQHRGVLRLPGGRDGQPHPGRVVQADGRQRSALRRGPDLGSAAGG